MSDSPFFQFYPSDWLAGTRGLTAAETGVYITLVAMMYEAEGPIPADYKRLSRLCGSTQAAFKKAVDGLLETGKLTLREGQLSQSRVEIEIEKRSEKRAAASASANARWRKSEQKQTPTDASASDPQCDRNANQKPDTRVEKEEPNGSSKKRASRLPADWRLPKAWGEWAIEEGLSEVCVRREADKFRDYWVAAPSAKAAKLDWLAVWRNWVRKAVDDRAQRLKPANANPQFGDERILANGQKQVFAGPFDGWVAG